MSLSAFIEGKSEPLHILWIATMGVAGEAWVFLDDSLGILTWGHAAVVPWQGAVRSVQCLVVPALLVEECAAPFPRVFLYREPAAVTHAVGADIRAHTEQLVTHPVKLGDGLIVPDEPGVYISFCHCFLRIDRN